MRVIALSAAAAALGLAAPASAQVPIPGTGLSVSGEAELMSDYRFRGISRSDEDPAGQANVTLGHSSGLYVGTRATTLSGLDNFRLRDPQVQDLGDLELDLYAGYSADLGGGLTLDGGLMYYVFTGDVGQADYAEPYVSLSYLLGPVEATAGAKYAPSQRGTGDEDMLYVFGELEAGIPFTPLTLRAHAGRQDWGRYGSYTNWSVGGSYSIGPAELGLRYVDTSLPSASGQDAGVVVSLGLGF
ncbi:MAG TPA: TorF family putative porin, partial [Allosphingosinicella sp.]